MPQPPKPTSDSVLRARPDGVTLAVRAQPGAKKTAILGIHGEGTSSSLKIAVHAPPFEGRANEALIAFLAHTFSLPRFSIGIVSGGSSRSKVLLLRGASLADLQSTLSSLLKVSS